MDMLSAAEGENTFNSPEQADRFLREHFSALSSAGIAESIVAASPDTALIQKVTLPSTTPPGAAPVLVPRYRWVIKNEDLGLADAILDALRNAGSVGFFVGASSTDIGKWAAAAVGTFTALFKLCRNVLNKGGVLSSEAYTVLVTLKTLGPLSNEDLLPKLQQCRAEWNAETLVKTLEALKAMPMRNGTVRALVSQDDQRRWLTADV